MAYAVQLLIGSTSRVVMGDNAQEVTLSLTYQLESGDTDLMRVVQEKSQEVARAHRRAWNTLHDEAVKRNPVNNTDHQDGGSVGQEEAGRPASQDETASSATAPPLAPITAGQLAALRALLKQAGWSEAQQETHLREQFDCERLNDLSSAQAAQWLLELQRAARTQAEQQRPTRSAASPNGTKNGATKT